MLVAVKPPALFQVIKHLFHGRPEFEIVPGPSHPRGLQQQAERLLPELIVVNVRPLRTDVCQTVTSIKRFSPGSKLILICPVREFASGARRCGADAYLEEEGLIRRLLPTARQLSERARGL